LEIKQCEIFQLLTYMYCRLQ